MCQEVLKLQVKEKTGSEKEGSMTDRRERETNEERQIAKFVSAWQDVGKTTELDVMV